MKRFLGQTVDSNPVAELDRYILEGGFPKALDYPRMADKRAYVRSVVKEVFEKDIRRRTKVKNVSVFDQVRDYVINNFGATTSLTNWPTVRLMTIAGLGIRAIRSSRQAGVRAVSSPDRISSTRSFHGAKSPWVVPQ